MLSGYYGFGNLGDDALLAVIVGELRTRYPYAEIDVLSAQPEVTAHELGVDATPRADLARVKEAINRADIVLSGGGGLLQNATSLKSLLYYAGILRTAIRAKRKTMIFAQSIGPLDFWGKNVVRECCKGLSRAAVRDERSKRLLGSIIGEDNVERTGDPVFLYQPPTVAPDLRADGLGPESAPYVVVSVRKTPGFNEGIPLLAAAVDRLTEEYGARVVFLPLGGQQDAEVSTSIIRKCRTTPMLLPPSDLDKTSAIIRNADALIGMRLHALILAIRCGVPFLAIPYDPKVAALCEDIDYPLPPLWVPGGHPKRTVEQAEALVDRLWGSRESLRRVVAAGDRKQADLARRNFDILSELVSHP